MNKYLRLLLIALIIVPLTALADKPKAPKGNKKRERAEWFQKLIDYRHKYMTKELDLTREQQEAFLSLYDAKEQERHEAERRVHELEKSIKKMGDAVTDKDYDKAIAAQYKLNSEIASIEAKYEAKFRKILTKRQLFKLRSVERGFQRKLMDERKGCPPPPKP